MLSGVYCFLKLLFFYSFGEINNEQENLNKCNGYHFHKCAFSDENENNNKRHKNHHSADSKNNEVFVFFSVFDKGEQKRYYRESNKKTCCNPVGNSFGIPVFYTVAESKRNNANSDK